MIRIAAKACSSYNRPKSLDSRKRLPSYWYAEIEFDVCFLKTVGELAFYRFPDRVISKTQEIAAPERITEHLLITRFGLALTASQLLALMQEIYRGC